MEAEADTAAQQKADRIDAVPVKITGYQVVDQTKGPDFGAYGTLSFPAGAGTPQRLLSYDDHRFEARLFVFATGAAPATATAYNGAGTVADPAAGATLSNVAVNAAGWYNVTATLVLSGAPTTADINNWYMTGIGGGNQDMPNGDTAGVPYQAGPFLVYLPGTTSVSARALTIGSGAATYQVVINVSPATGPVSAAAPAGVWVGSEAQVSAAPRLGMFVPVGSNFALHHNQRVWIAGDLANSVSVSWQVERFDSPPAQISDDD